MKMIIIPWGEKGVADGNSFLPPHNDYHSLKNAVFCFFGIFYSLEVPKRYELDNNINKELSSELDWLKSVKDLLSQEAHRKKGNISGLSLELLIEEYFNETIEKLEKM